MSESAPVKIVCLIGSSRFKVLFHHTAERLEKSGVLPLMMGFFQHADNRTVTPADREVLRRVDRARIDLAQEVLVVDGQTEVCSGCGKPCKVVECTSVRLPSISRCCKEVVNYRPYVGADTRHEIDYAESVGKPVRYLSKEPMR